LAWPQGHEEPLGVGQQIVAVHEATGHPALAALFTIELRLDLQVRVDGRDPPVVHVDVRGPGDRAPTRVAEPTEHLVEEQRHCAAVDRAAASEVEPREPDPSAHRVRRLGLGHERHQERLGTTRFVVELARGRVALVDHPRLERRGDVVELGAHGAHHVVGRIGARHEVLHDPQRRHEGAEFRAVRGDEPRVVVPRVRSRLVS
jgi:hypothetical protein